MLVSKVNGSFIHLSIKSILLVIKAGENKGLFDEHADLTPVCFVGDVITNDILFKFFPYQIEDILGLKSGDLVGIKNNPRFQRHHVQPCLALQQH